jgi:hypothetical protein
MAELEDPGVTSLDRTFWETRTRGVGRIVPLPERRPRLKPGERLQNSWNKVSVTEGEMYRSVVPSRLDTAAVRPGSHSEKPAWMRVPQVESTARPKQEPWDFITKRKVLSTPCLEGSQVSYESPSWFHSKYYSEARVPIGPYRTVANGNMTMLVPLFEEDPAAKEGIASSTLRGRRSTASLPRLPPLPGSHPNPREGKPFRNVRAFTMNATYGSGKTIPEGEEESCPDYTDVKDVPRQWVAARRGLPTSHARPLSSGGKLSSSLSMLPSAVKEGSEAASVASGRPKSVASASVAAGSVGSGRPKSVASSRPMSVVSGRSSARSERTASARLTPMGSVRSVRSRGSDSSLAFASQRSR